MKCEKCGSENLDAAVTFDHIFLQVNGKWKFTKAYEQNPGDSAQINCLDCGHEMFDQIPVH